LKKGSYGCADLIAIASKLTDDEKKDDSKLTNILKKCKMLKIEQSLEVLKVVLNDDSERLKTKGSSLINVFKLDNEENQSVELAILRAFLNSHKTEYYKNLKLALQWNRVDIAKIDIFTGEEKIEASELRDLLKMALINDNTEFVELFLDLVDLESFLTVSILNELYNSKKLRDNAKKCPLFKLYPYERSEPIITSNGLKKFFKRYFFDEFDVKFLPDNMANTNAGNERVQYPAKNMSVIFNSIKIYF